MSMLSAQCDELRSMAASVGLEMPQAATLMMEAADTIWELRGMVHRERAEVDRLREQGARLFDKTLELGTENERLRELVRDMWDFYCVVPDEPHASKEEIDFSIEVWKRMRELRIEMEQ